MYSRIGTPLGVTLKKEEEMEYLLLIPIVGRIVISLLGYKSFELEDESKFFTFALPGFFALVALVLLVTQIFSLEIIVFLYCAGELGIATVKTKEGRIGIILVFITILIYLGILGN